MSSSSPSTSGNGNSQFSDGTVPPIDRKALEMQIVSQAAITLQKVAVEKIDSDRLTPEEMITLRNIVSSGIWIGALAGGVSLFLLRSARAQVFRAWMNQRQQFRQNLAANKNHSTEASSPSSLGSAQANLQSPLPSSPPPPISGTLYAINCVVDFMLSLCIATGVTSYYCFKADRLLDGLSALVLKEGDSILADNFCPVAINEIYKVRRDPTTMTPRTMPVSVIQHLSKNDVKDCLRHPQTVELQKFMQFYQNCQKRAEVERRVKMERGLQLTDPLDIPFPGVPFDMAALPDTSFDDDDADGNFGYEISGESFVTDLEDDTRK